MITGLLIFLFMVATGVIVLFYTEDGNGNEIPMPRYGGAPVVLNEMLRHAKANGDGDKEMEIHAIRKKLFRNRRSFAEQKAGLTAAEDRLIAQYGDAGRQAIAAEHQRQAILKLTPEEKEVIIAAHIKDGTLLITEPRTKPKPKGGKK